MTKKYLFTIFFFSTLFVLLFSVSANASTSDALDAFYETRAAGLGSGYYAPNISDSNDFVDVSRGDVIINETDYVIKGRNGMEIPIIRSYNPDRLSGTVRRWRWDNTVDVAYKIGYYYINTSNDEKILVGFNNEYDAYEYKDGITGVNHQTKNQNTSYSINYYAINTLINEEGTYFYERDLTSQPVIISDESTTEYFRLQYCYADQYVSLGSGWCVLKPSCVYFNDRTVGDYYRYQLTFCDIYGKYSNLEITFKEDYEGADAFYSYDFLDDHRDYTIEFVDTDNFTTTNTHPGGFDYNFTIKDGNGITYYMYYSYSQMNIPIRGISDRYGNTFKYDYSDHESDSHFTLTDCASGVIYTVNPSGITVTTEDETNQIVSYNHQEINGENDDGDVYLCDNSFSLTVYANDDASVDASESDNYKVYNMSRVRLRNKLFNPNDLDDYDDVTIQEMTMASHFIDSVDYSNGLTKYYVYDKIGTEDNVLEKHAVVKTYEKLNGVEYNKKEYSYAKTYTAPVTSSYVSGNNVNYTGKYEITRTEIHDYKSPTIERGYNVFFFDEFGRMESKYCFCDDERFLLEEYTYDCDCFDAQPEKYTVTKDGTITTTNTYDDRHRLTKVVYGDTVTEYAYGDNNIITETTRTKDEATIVKTVNTLTEDKKSIANTKVYDGDELNYSKTYTYNSDGTLASETLPNNGGSGIAAYSYQYNTDGSYVITRTVADVTDADGQNPVNISTQTTVDIYGNVIKTRDANGNETLYDYDLLSRNTRIIGADGGITTYTRNDTTNVIDITDAENKKFRYTFDPWGNCTSYQYCVSGTDYDNIESAQYDYNHRLDEYYKYNDSEDYYWIGYEYDNQNRIIREYMRTPTDAPINQTDYTYTESSDSEERPLTITTMQTSGYGKTFAKTELTIDYLGRTLTKKLIDTDDNTITYTNTYDYFGNILTTTHPDNSIETYTYDGLGNVLSYANQLGWWTSYTYDLDGSLDTYTDFNGNTTVYYYDKAGRPIKIVAPYDGTTKSTSKTYYDANGNVIKEAVQISQDGFRTTDYAYDNMNRLSFTTTHPTATTSEITQYFYDKTGNVTHMFTGLTAPLESIESIPENSHYTSYTYDNLNNCTSVGGTLTSYTEYEYDNSGNVISKETYDGDFSYEYDAFGNVVAVYENNELTDTFGYNAIGQRTYMNDSTGTTTYTYDDFGNLTRESKGDIVKTSTYDALGRRTGFNVGYGNSTILSNTYSYDIVGRMTSATSNGETIDYTYDYNGNILTESVGGYTTETEYNDANLPTVVYRNGSHIYNAFYDRSGNMTMLEDVESLLTLEYTYDSANRLSNELQCNYFDLTEENKAWSYSFDLLGNRTNMGKSDYANSDSKTYAYTYDNHNRLETVAVSIDNQLQHTINYAWPGGSGASFSTRVLHKETFDTDEMLIGLELYAYDVRGRLTEFGSFDDSATYTYNGDNLRETKSSGAKETTFVYDGGDIVAEIISSGETEEIITYGRGLRLFCRMKNNVASYYFYNLHGDVVKLISETGATETVRYDAHGNFIGEGFTDNPFGYSGEYHDKESGFIYLRARYYDPETGRFISEDPIMDGTNWYVYCSNNPVMFVDPWGLAVKLTGDSVYWQTTFDELQALTDDVLDYDKEKGEVYIVERNDNGKYISGTELVRSLVDNNDYTVNIQRNGINQDSGNYYGSQIVIKNDEQTTINISDDYNNNDSAYKIVRDANGNSVPEFFCDTESYIILGHELIHAYRRMLGINVTGRSGINLYVYNGVLYEEVMPLSQTNDEFETVGLNYITPYLNNPKRSIHPRWVPASKNKITENALRKEHQLNLLVAYENFYK